MYDVYRGRKVGMCSLLPLCSTTYLPRMYCAKDDFHAFPRFVKGKHEVVDRSIMDVQHTGKSTRSAANVLWGKSTECLLYKKKIEPRPGAGAVRVTKGGNPIDKRPNRAFGTHTIRALASGAAAALGAEWSAQSKLMRCNTNGEYERYPMLPAVTPGGRRAGAAGSRDARRGAAAL